MAYIPPRKLVRSIAPATEPLTLEETKLFLRVDASTEDALITKLIVAARETAEGYLRRSLITQQWTLSYGEFFPSRVHLPMGPVTALIRVSQRQTDGSTTNLSSTLYYLGLPDTLVLMQCVSAPIMEAVYIAGYGSATDVPQAIRQGLLTHTAAMYDGRSESVALPEATKALYRPYRGLGL